MHSPQIANRPNSLSRFAVLVAFAVGNSAPQAFAQQLCENDEFHASDTHSLQYFGSHLDVDIGRLVVGAERDHELSNEAGAVYVYSRNGLNWIEEDKLLGDPAFGDERLGHRVAIQGNLIVASAVEDTFNVIGSAYIFRDTGSGYTRTRIAPGDGVNGDHFGADLAVEGDIVAIGSPGHTTTAGSSDGAVYVYERQGPDWIFQQQLIAPGSMSNRGFGRVVAISSGSLIVGLEIGPLIACVFEQVAGTWTLVQELPRPANGGASSMDVDGSRLVIGSKTTGAQGGIYIYEKTGALYVLTQSLQQVPFGGSLRLGKEVAIQGTTLIVATENLPSHVYLYDLSGSSPAFRAQLMRGDFHAPEHMPADGLGIDGSTLLVSTGIDHSGGNFAGAVYAYEPSSPAPGTSYCFCPLAVAPCGNADPDAGCANAGGSGARLRACRTDLASMDSLVLSVLGTPEFSFGLIYTGMTQVQLPLGNGLRCIGGQLFRFPVQSAGNGGFLSIGPGIIDHAATNFGPAGQIVAGDTWHFQAWYRDTVGPCGGTSNFSNALSITFQP